MENREHELKVNNSLNFNLFWNSVEWVVRRREDFRGVLFPSHAHALSLSLSFVLMEHIRDEVE